MKTQGTIKADRFFKTLADIAAKKFNVEVKATVTEKTKLKKEETA